MKFTQSPEFIEAAAAESKSSNDFDFDQLISLLSLEKPHEYYFENGFLSRNEPLENLIRFKFHEITSHVFLQTELGQTLRHSLCLNNKYRTNQGKSITDLINEKVGVNHKLKNKLAFMFWKYAQMIQPYKTDNAYFQVEARDAFENLDAEKLLKLEEQVQRTVGAYHRPGIISTYDIFDMYRIMIFPSTTEDYARKNKIESTGFHNAIVKSQLVDELRRSGEIISQMLESIYNRNISIEARAPSM